MSTTTPTTTSTATSTAAPTTTSTAAMTPGLFGRVGFTDGTPYWGPDFDALQREDPEIAAVVLGELDRLRGASANLAAYAALLSPGDTVLAMSLPHGGHLTHGSKVNFSGKWFHTIGYGVRADTELIDYDQVRALAHEHRPKMIICGATAYPRLIDFAAFREIADEVGAWLLVDAAHFIGLVAGKAIPSPVPYADVVTFTTHKVLRGPRGGMIVCREELAQRIDKAVFPFSQGGPLMHAVAAKAVALAECLRPDYQAYAQQVIDNARALAAGLAATACI